MYNNDKINQKELAERCFKDKAALTRSLEVLERKELVKRENSMLSALLIKLMKGLLYKEFVMGINDVYLISLFILLITLPLGIFLKRGTNN